MSKTILLKNNTKLSVCARDQCQVPWSAEDLKILELWEEELPDEIVSRIQREFQNIPETVLNPSLWTQTP